MRRADRLRRGAPRAEGGPGGARQSLAPAIPDVLVFSGRPREEWELNCPEIRLAARLVDGAFEEDNPRPEAWRGSANQNMTVYSPGLAGAYENWRRERKGRLRPDRPRDMVVGIPFQRNFRHRP
jgi:hypothetical protein